MIDTLTGGKTGGLLALFISFLIGSNQKS